MRTTRNRDSRTLPSLSSASAIPFAAGEEESFFASCLVHNILNVQVTNPMTGRHIGLEIKADATSCLNSQLLCIADASVMMQRSRFLSTLIRDRKDDVASIRQPEVIGRKFRQRFELERGGERG